MDGDIIVIIYPSMHDQGKKRKSCLYKASKPEIAVPMYEGRYSKCKRFNVKESTNRFLVPII
jgi:hypothetical protein